MKRLIASVFFCIPPMLCAAQDALSTLAEMLAAKRIISADELAKVQSSSAQDRLRALATLLRDKGVLDSNDLAKLSLGPAGLPVPQPQPAVGPSSATPAVFAPTTVIASSPKAPPAPAQAKPVDRTEVNTGKHVPVTLYGTILFNAGFNTAGFNLEDDGTIVAKPGSSPTAQKQSFYETARQTRVGLRLNPVHVAGASLTGDLQIDAYSSSAPFPNGMNMSMLRVRLAYGRLDWQNVALLVGQDWSIFAPLNPTSLAMYAVAELNGAGNPWTRTPQIRLEAKSQLNSSNRLLYQLAFSDPNVGDYGGAFTGTLPPGAGEFGRMPAIESRLALTKFHNDRDYSLGFSGRYGRGRNIAAAGTAIFVQPVDSWGAALDWTLPLTGALNLTGEAYIGRALGLYGVALGEAVGTVGRPSGRGVLSRGGWIQPQFNINKQWQLNAAYGIDDPSAHDLGIGSRNRNQNVLGNFLYKPNANINFSMQYRRILTDFRNQALLTGRANQFTLSAAYLF